MKEVLKRGHRCRKEATPIAYFDFMSYSEDVSNKEEVFSGQVVVEIYNNKIQKGQKSSLQFSRGRTDKDKDKVRTIHKCHEENLIFDTWPTLQFFHPSRLVLYVRNATLHYISQSVLLKALLLI